MNTTTNRVVIAQKVGNICLQLAPKQIAAIAITGSTAMEWADGFSDAEVAIFWHQIPTISIRDQIVKRLNGVVTRRVSAEDAIYWMGVDNIIAHEFCIDLIHNTKALFERQIREVIDDLDTAIEKQKLLFVLANCQSIYGADFLFSLKQQIAHYPNQLSHLLLVKYSNFRPLGGIIVSALRNDTYNFYNQLNDYVRKMMILLFALNKQYFPVKLKQIPRYFSRLPIQPKLLEQRYRQLYTAKPTIAYKVLTELIGELFTLLQQHYSHPQIQKNRQIYLTIRRKYSEAEQLKHWPAKFEATPLEKYLKQIVT